LQSPQNRLRVIMVAAKNGLHMPRPPPPTHQAGPYADSLKKEFHGNIIYPEPGPYTLLPCLTVRDAISDLPDLGDGENLPFARYKEGSPFSAYQAEMRRNTEDGVCDHQCAGVGSGPASVLQHVPRDNPLLEDGSFDGGDENHRTVIDGKYRGRCYWQRSFNTIVTVPSIKTASMVHPSDNRFFSVRELARGQGFPDDCKFYGSRYEKYKQVGNAVPVRLAKAIGKQILQAIGLSTKSGPEKSKYFYHTPDVAIPIQSQHDRPKQTSVSENTSENSNGSENPCKNSNGRENTSENSNGNSE